MAPAVSPAATETFARLCNVVGSCALCSMPTIAAERDVVAETVNASAATTVVTPTRLRQSLRDVPASVTVITSDMLQRLGISSIVDALRLVPGMHVTQASGNRILVNYHGTNNRDPRRLNVLDDLHDLDERSESDEQRIAPFTRHVAIELRQ